MLQLERLQSSHFSNLHPIWSILLKTSWVHDSMQLQWPAEVLVTAHNVHTVHMYSAGCAVHVNCEKQALMI